LARHSELDCQQQGDATDELALSIIEKFALDDKTALEQFEERCNTSSFCGAAGMQERSLGHCESLATAKRLVLGQDDGSRETRPWTTACRFCAHENPDLVMRRMRARLARRRTRATG
jgi:hypothetical protein